MISAWYFKNDKKRYVLTSERHHHDITFKFVSDFKLISGWRQSDKLSYSGNARTGNELTQVRKSRSHVYLFFKTSAARFDEIRVVYIIFKASAACW